MVVQCENCQEVHLGVVNRCWKCGEKIPILSVAVAPSAASQDACEPTVGSVFESGTSPFGKASQVLRHNPDEVRAHHSRESLALGYLIASFVIGGSALLASQLTGWTIFPAAIALGCSIASLQLRRSWIGFLALFLCLLALLLASMTAYDSLVEMYQLRFKTDDF